MKVERFRYKEEIKEYLNNHRGEPFVQDYDDLMKNERVHILFEAEDILKYAYYVDDKSEIKRFMVVRISKVGRGLEIEQVYLFESDVVYMAKKLGLL